MENLANSIRTQVQGGKRKILSKGKTKREREGGCIHICKCAFIQETSDVDMIEDFSIGRCITPALVLSIPTHVGVPEHSMNHCSL